jgi:hypothetical protein
MKEQLTTCVDENGVITIQRAEYIEYGWVIVVSGATIRLFEIPYGGGERMLVDSYDTIIDAIRAAKLLT